MLYVKYSCKPFDLYDVEKDVEHAQETKVIETITLTTEEYDQLTKNLFNHQEWCAGKGGACKGIIQAIKVTAPNRETLYVNPEGYEYPRYVGFASE